MSDNWTVKKPVVRSARGLVAAQQLAAAEVGAGVLDGGGNAIDAALALGMAHVMVEEGIYDRRFVVEQSDLPFLVRADSGLFLRESDMLEAGRDERATLTVENRGETNLYPRLVLSGLPPVGGEKAASNGLRLSVSPWTFYFLGRSN